VYRSLWVKTLSCHRQGEPALGSLGDFITKMMIFRRILAEVVSKNIQCLFI